MGLWRGVKMKSKQDFLTAKESPGMYRAHVLQTDPLPSTEGSVQAAAGHSDRSLHCACMSVQVLREIIWLKCGPEPALRRKQYLCVDEEGHVKSSR